MSADSVREIWSDLSPPPPGAALREGARLGWRLWRYPRAIASCVLAAPVLAVAAAGVSGGILRLGGFDPARPLESPVLLRTAGFVLFAGAALGWLVMRGMLHRLAEEVAANGRVRRSWRANRELDILVGNLGVWQTAVSFVFLVPAALVPLAGGATGVGALLYSVSEPEGPLFVALIAFSLTIGAALLWAVLLLPLQWAVPLMAEHDCGWLRGLETSTRLFALDPSRSLALGLTSFLYSLSGLGLPVSAGVLSEGLRSFGPIVQLLLKERTERQTRNLVAEREDQAPQPKAVRRGYELLDQGRYLDAVNAFQMVLLRQFAQPEAMRGEALGLLCLGNLGTARQRLERWRSLDAEDPEPARLLRELEAGEWSEGGEKHREARARCTQEIGRGLTAGETLSEQALEDIRRAARG